MNTSNTTFLRRAKSLHTQKQVLEQQRILVVESDGMSRLMTLLFLRRLGFAVDWAVNPSMALHKLRAGCLDVLLLGLPMRGGAAVEILNAIPNESEDDGEHKPVRVYVYALTHQMDRATCKAVEARAEQVIDKATTPPDALILGIAADLLQAPVHPELLQTSRAEHAEITASSDSRGQLADAVAQLREDWENLLLNRNPETFPAECRELRSRLQCLSSFAVEMKLDALGREALALANLLLIVGNDPGMGNQADLRKFASGMHHLMKVAEGKRSAEDPAMEESVPSGPFSTSRPAVPQQHLTVRVQSVTGVLPASGGTSCMSNGAHRDEDDLPLKLNKFVNPVTHLMRAFGVQPRDKTMAAELPGTSAAAFAAKAQAQALDPQARISASAATENPVPSMSVKAVEIRVQPVDASTQRATNASLATDAERNSWSACENAVKLEEPGQGTTEELLAQPDVLNPGFAQQAVVMQQDQMRSNALRRDLVMPEASSPEPVARLNTAVAGEPLMGLELPQMQLASASQMVQEAESSRQSWQARQNQLESDLAASQQLNAELEARCAEAQSLAGQRIEALERELWNGAQAFEMQSEALRQQQAAAETAQRGFERERQEWQTRQSQLVSDLTALRQSHDEMLVRHEAALADSEKRQEALKQQMHEAAAGWQRRLEDLTAQLASANGSTRTAQAQHEEAQKRCEQLERELAALRQSHHELHCRHKASVVGSVQRLAALKQQMQEAAAELQKSQDELRVQLVEVKAPVQPAVSPVPSGESADAGAARSEAGSRH